MQRLLISSLIFGLAMGAGGVAHAGDSAAVAGVAMAGRSYSTGGAHVAKGHMMSHRWGPRIDGRWYAGHRAPGGWNSFRRPFVGYVLPRYWVQPSYYIADYGNYGLPAPAYGYGWSRYYDEAVLTDRYGRVYDSRAGVAWDRYEGGYDDGAGYGYTSPYADPGYDPRYDRGYAPAKSRDNTATGAVIGGVVGGVIGNRVAGRGNRTVGTILGAGAGAIAGGAIASASGNAHDNRPAAPYSYGSPNSRGAPIVAPHDVANDRDDGVTYHGTYSGRWVGTWYGEDGRTYSGEYRGTYNGNARGQAEAAAPPPPRGAQYESAPHWADVPPPAYAAPAVAPGYGYGMTTYGYAPGTVTTTTIIEPTTVTTTTYVEEVSTYRKPRKVMRPKARVRCVPKPRCVCR